MLRWGNATVDGSPWPIRIALRPGTARIWRMFLMASGDSIIAINAFLSANDDHTFLFGPAGNFVVHPFVYSKLSYDPKELIPVARASNTTPVIVLRFEADSDAALTRIKEAFRRELSAVKPGATLPF